MLFVVKGTEADAISEDSEAAQIPGESSLVFEESHTSMNIRNLSAIFKNVAENMTALTRDLQTKVQTFGEKLHSQTSDMLSKLMGGIQRPDEDVFNAKLQSLTQQLESLKTNISLLNIGLDNFNQSSREKAQQDLTRSMEKLQEAFSPLIRIFQGTLAGGVESMRNAMAPEVHKIKRLVSLAESKDTTLETP
ncbi:hypothetical protein scyTo_0002408 [Scyliorhinus torazame]|uniref:Uncharacterized protein n=1 Tax=Scyliorhinus torazame TaxID=75743 RepID=A0A401PJA1_SCYTO|nr:hypothetical protein [Scyliorhinus torazame]